MAIEKTLPDEVTLNGRVYVAKDTVTDGPWTTELTLDQQRFLADVMAGYPPTKVDKVMGWGNGRCARLVRSKLLSCVDVPETDRFKVTPAQVAEYMASCVRHADTS